MAKKVSRELLKEIVKECLVEILSEGLSQREENLGYVASTRSEKKQSPTRRKTADLISYGSENKQKTNTAVESRIKQVAGGNNIMESILRDTAKNTLPTMMAADNRRGGMSMIERTTRGDAATKAMATADPMDVFEGASKWATLAFHGNSKSKQE